MKKVNLSVVISLLIAIIVDAALFYTGIITKIYGTVLLSIVTFLLSYISIELPKYISELRKNNELNRYQKFIDNGIIDFYPDFTEIQFRDDISSAHNIKLLLMYSRNFITNNLSSIREFLQKEGSMLDVIFIKDDIRHPVYSYLTQKYNYPEDKLSGSLRSFVHLIEFDIAPYIHQDSRINIYQIDFLPAYSLFMFDEHAYITLYKTAPERTTTVPSLKIAKARHSDFFQFLVGDISELVKHKDTEHLVITRSGRMTDSGDTTESASIINAVES